MGVFFEGTASQDSSGISIDDARLLGCELRDFEWKFERETAPSTYVTEEEGVKGFNTAYVFEPPGSLGPNGEPTSEGGTYRVTLTVTDKNDVSNSTTQEITVSAFTGTTYYVRADGDDGNTGTGPGASEAWQTYDKAFTEIQNVSAGDRVLLNRGDTFTYTTQVNLNGNLGGVLMGTYGDGYDPIISYIGSTSGSGGAPIRSNAVLGIAFADLSFDCNNGGIWADGFAIGRSKDVVLLRVTITDCDAGEVTSTIDVDHSDKIFFADSTIANVLTNALFYSGSRLAVINCIFGPSVATGSHNIYGSLLDRAVIRNTILQNPATGRLNLRVAANHSTSRNVVIWNNDMDGNDVLDSPTPLAVHLGNSSGTWEETHHCVNLLIEDNTIYNTEGPIKFNNDHRDTIIRNNILEADIKAIHIEGSVHIPDGYDGPMGVWIYNNTITNGGADWFTDISPSSEDVYLWDNTVNSELIEGTPDPNF